MAIQTPDEVNRACLNFFKNFQSDDGNFKYVNRINRMIRDGERSLVIDYEDLVLIDDAYEYDLASTLLDKPHLMLDEGSKALAEHVKMENADYFWEIKHERDNFFLRFSNTPNIIHIRDLRANHVDSWKWIEGIIVRTTEIKSIVTHAVFYCVDEKHTIDLYFEDGIFNKPNKCNDLSCKAKEFVLDHYHSKMIDWQYITVQERPEDLPPGASPKSVPCRLTDDIVDIVRPGDRVQLGGIIRSRPSKLLKKGQVLTFDIWMDVNFIESTNKEDEFTDISPEEEKQFLDMALDPKIHEHLIDSIAPAIHGLREVKEAAMYMLFGGVDKQFPDGFSTRGQPNVLIVGDPGVAKSQLLRYVQSIAPRGLYTSGKGSSAAGLTAAITRDPETSEITLEAGAMVLADRGVCLIDEFDKMNENDRSAIHEAMEQHTVSVAKAGIVATLNARTGVLAAANPKYGRYEPHRTFSENVNLTPAILSRFDLVFILQDEPNEQNDSILADHILKLHRYHGSTQSIKPPMNEETLKKYISYAKRNYNPALLPEATELLEEFYVTMRNSYGKSGESGKSDRVTITARQLEGIIRLAEARARAALRTQVTKNDAQKSIDIMKYSLSHIAKDPETGQADIDALYSGQTGTKRTKLTKLMSIIDFLSRESGGPFSQENLIQEAKDQGLTQEYVMGVIQQMRRDGTLYQPKPGWFDKP
ncbi:MAG: minichromosome maintenance protein MCM [Candidatus Heimdallarchaeota archaeon]|nr:minichromosome maintenance protein MCM [Candidatus Heimdallarchaeota archaeon]MDH5644608.1 minichromosome maintenance protein MCM [Candidatus Heimdallarchaeota archaeon]